MNHIAVNIILLKKIQKIHTEFKNNTDSKIDLIIGAIMKHKDKNRIFVKIQEVLSKNPIGKEVIEEHQTFKSFSVSVFN